MEREIWSRVGAARINVVSKSKRQRACFKKILHVVTSSIIESNLTTRETR
jgi:hypothetical protein